MFENIGNKLKTLAYVVTIIGMIGSVIGGILYAVAVKWWIGILVIVFGCLGSWVGTFLIYGFGELICKTTEIADNTKKQSVLAVAEAIEKSDLLQNSVHRAAVETMKKQILQESADKDLEMVEDENIPLPDECPNCFAIVSESDETCPNCGYKLRKR